jgi:hypothetical protein
VADRRQNTEERLVAAGLCVEVRRHDIFVIAPNEGFIAIYTKPARLASALVARRTSGSPEFKVRAWARANDEARAMGWIV